MNTLCVGLVSIICLWLIVSFIMLKFFSVQCKSGDKLNTHFWVWSVVITLSLCVPVLGWIFLADSMWYALSKKECQIPLDNE